MTTAAMVAGMLPLALALEPGSAQRRSLGVVVIGGLLSSLLLTLVVVPVAFVRFAPRRIVRVPSRYRRRCRFPPKRPCRETHRTLHSPSDTGDGLLGACVACRNDRRHRFGEATVSELRRADDSDRRSPIRAVRRRRSPPTRSFAPIEDQIAGRPRLAGDRERDSARTGDDRRALHAELGSERGFGAGAGARSKRAATTAERLADAADHDLRSQPSGGRFVDRQNRRVWAPGQLSALVDEQDRCLLSNRFRASRSSRSTARSRRRFTSK